MERPRASLLSWDTRYLVARPVACVSEMNGLGIAKKYKRYSFSELKVWTGKPINRPSIFLFHCPYYAYSWIPQYDFYKEKECCDGHGEAAGDIDFCLKE